MRILALLVASMVIWAAALAGYAWLTRDEPERPVIGTQRFGD